MDKILFYGNSVAEFELFTKYRNALENEGFELAYATDNRDLLMLLAVQKMLLVNPNTYYADICVVHDGKINIKAGRLMTFTEFEKVITSD